MTNLEPNDKPGFWWYVLSIGEFWVALFGANVIAAYTGAPIWLLSAVLWLTIHFALPAIFRYEPLW